ncbi:MAG TPA: TOPRIM nucleotidyl transferase/hydrolase domain-containing protein, partial [Actinomycetota bacterium]|nr:TOPRIM nucleotidyl transferase/hydrolase domain-containing protein [Actinomycetota bacterium]
MTTLPHAVILVEGVSDRRALEALAARRGRVLTADGVTVVAMGGAGNIGRFLDRFGPRGSRVVLAGLYDAAEEAAVRRGLERAGFGSVPSRRALER